MFTKILIANRGEIACRIMRTAKRLGIHCVAIYSEADTDALHVKLADEAYCVGKASSQESYLRADTIIDIAVKTGCQAIHPGYGFLSENAEFAEKCSKAKICFIGPPAAAIRAMGSKSAAKKIMAQAKVPMLPGYHEDDQDVTTLQKAADKIGYPLLIKAVAGGGGKGMRVVWQTTEFTEALTAAKREALASFNDDRVLLEKYLTKPRHVEMQVFADQQGNVVHLFERDCSIQRRHQKIIEEAPAPLMPEKLREKMGKAAVSAAKAINYVGAGTIEFLLDENQQFYFMEMNTRLQVEHPVTEMITQQDLVEWQLQVAYGESLPLKQNELQIHGHAFEVRIYAEDPAQNYLPSIGTLQYLKTPEENVHVRIDTGVITRCKVSPYYDAMITKLIVWDKDRATALQQLQNALAQYQIVGVTTNLDLLSDIAQHNVFAQGDVETGFIEKYKLLTSSHEPASNEIFVIATLALLQQQKILAEQNAYMQYDPASPWFITDSWRLNLPYQQTIDLQIQQQQKNIIIENETNIKIDGNLFSTQTEWLDQYTLLATINNQQIQADIYLENDFIYLLIAGKRYQFSYLTDSHEHDHDLNSDKARLTAPMPGKVVALIAAVGKPVERGSALAVVEAMKMEHTIHAPNNGIVKEWYYQVGDMVDEGQALLAFEEII